MSKKSRHSISQEELEKKIQDTLAYIEYAENVLAQKPTAWEQLRSYFIRLGGRVEM